MAIFPQTINLVALDQAIGNAIKQTGSATNTALNASYTTANRPAANTVGDGQSIYDTTLNKPLWSDGTAWRDATGTAV